MIRLYAILVHYLNSPRHRSFVHHTRHEHPRFCFFPLSADCRALILCMQQAMIKTLTPPLRSDARGTRSRRSPTSTPPNPTYTDGSRRENRGRLRRHELRMSTLNTNRPTYLIAD